MRCKHKATVLDVQGAQQPPLLKLYFPNWDCAESHSMPGSYQ